MALNQLVSGLLHARWFVVLTAIATSVVVGLVFRYLWKEWTLFALAGAGFYLIGTFRLMPWKTALRKAVSIGIFIGIALPTIEWIYLWSV